METMHPVQPMMKPVLPAAWASPCILDFAVHLTVQLTVGQLSAWPLDCECGVAKKIHLVNEHDCGLMQPGGDCGLSKHDCGLIQPMILSMEDHGRGLTHPSKRHDGGLIQPDRKSRSTDPKSRCFVAPALRDKRKTGPNVCNLTAGMHLERKWLWKD